MICLPTRSLPVSLINEAETPERPNEMIPLNTDPPGTAPMGSPFLKIISRTVSPIPITFLIVFVFCAAKIIKKQQIKQIITDIFVTLRAK